MRFPGPETSDSDLLTLREAFSVPIVTADELKSLPIDSR